MGQDLGFAIFSFGCFSWRRLSASLFWSLVEDVVELLREKHRHRKRVCQNPENGKGALVKKIALIITIVINWRNFAILATI